MAAWPPLRSAITAAKDGDALGHANAMLAIGEQASRDPRSGFYVWYLLRARTREMVGRAPTVEDLSVVADAIYPRFAELVRVDRQGLDELLLGVWEIQDSERDVVGAHLVITGSAALGAMLTGDPDGLERLVPRLKAWLAANGDAWDDAAFA